MKRTSFFGKSKAFIAAHKVVTTVAVLIILIGGYKTYAMIAAKNVVPQYALAAARTGTIRQTVTGTGQVSAQNQIDLTSKATGQVTGIRVSVGQTVKAGDLIATIDSKNASIDLENARIAYQKLVEPPKEADVSSANDNLGKAYSDGFNTVTSMFLDLPNIMSGVNDIFNTREGYLSDQNSTQLLPSAQTYRTTAAQSYDKAESAYEALLLRYKALSRSSATSSIDAMISDSYELAKEAATLLQNTQNTVTYISSTQPQYFASVGATTGSNVKSWSTTVNGDLSALLAAENSIASAKNSLGTLVQGPDTLDVASERLSLSQKESAYADYFVRAPFDGIIGRIPAKVYDQAGGSTIIATIVGNKKIASISLNEVDAAKVKTGQSVSITFDAIDGLTATGSVSEVDQVGAVTQGVVSYGVKISIDTSDDRIRPGMSVNTTIITNEKSGVIIVPSSAIKTQGTRHYVQTLPSSVLPARPGTGGNGRNGSSTGANASSTRQFASSTRQFGQGSGANFGGFTVSTAVVPTTATVTVGDSDDTNTEITGGLDSGTLIVTRTVTTGATATAAAPSILNTLGGARGAGGGGGAGFRAGAAAGR